MRPPANRKSANLFLDETLVSEARDLKINVSRAAEDGITLAARAERERFWCLENAKAIVAMNAYTDNSGLPLARYRQF